MNNNNYKMDNNIDKMNDNINNKLDEALIMLKDTQNVGINILSELDTHREKIISMKNKTNNINKDITNSNIILRDMKKREQLCIIM